MLFTRPIALLTLAVAALADVDIGMFQNILMGTHIPFTNLQML